MFLFNNRFIVYFLYFFQKNAQIKTEKFTEILCIRFSGCLCHKPAAVALEAAAISDV